MLRCLQAWSQRMTALAPLVPSAPVLQQCRRQCHIPHACISKPVPHECCALHKPSSSGSPFWATCGLK